MPELLLELFSEEIPARFQRRAAEDLKKLVTGALVDAGLLFDGAAAFATPRRLALNITGIPARSPDLREEKKGPRVGAPQQAIDGFLKSAGLSAIEQAQLVSDPKKGEFYVAVVERKGDTAEAILAQALPKVIAEFPWPKSMRWGDGRMSWVRPLRAITATFGTDTEEPQVIPFAADGLASGQTTFGHRFLSPGAIRVKRFEDYSDALQRAHVVLDLDRRRDIIRHDAEQLAFAHGLTLIADEGLFEEVAGLVEWPVPMLGSFDPRFLEVPEEVIIATIRANQKCFCLRDKSGKLAPHFILVANTIPEDGGATIINGNERVIRARLSDAKFFYEQDLALPLDSGIPKLRDTVFHAKLGTQAARVERLVQLAGEIAVEIGADVGQARRAALVAKADLVTGMVGEFPELQGLMGRYYALAQGEAEPIANAIAQHYKPVGPNDQVPTEPVAIAVALADKLDLLAGFWAIDEKPTGSRDPFALRRAALGVIRIITENGLTLPLNPLFAKCIGVALATASSAEQGIAAAFLRARSAAGGDWHAVSVDELPQFAEILLGRAPTASAESEFFDGQRAMELQPFTEPLFRELLSFFHDRLKVSLRDAGARYDLVDAVITERADDILDITRRVAALSTLLGSEDGQNLLAGYRRAVNIVVVEEKKDGRRYNDHVDQYALKDPHELGLALAVETANAEVSLKVGQGDYPTAVAALGQLRRPVDAFFEAVLVNDPDPAVRANRLNLLARLRDTMHLVADFSKISG